MPKSALLSMLLITVLAVACQKAPELRDPPVAKSPAPDAGTAKATNDSPAPYAVSEAERKLLVKENAELREKLKTVEAKLVAPATEDLAAYADFLKGAGTGVARLFAGAGPILVRGEGEFYSFKRLTHEYGFGSDISYRQNEFSVGFAGVDFGFFAKLGKVDVKEVNESNAVVAAMLAEKSLNGEQEPAWRAEQQKWSTGAMLDTVLARDRVVAEVGTTYALRSVNESNSDLVVVFQVVRRDELDQSIIIVWKIVKEFAVPELKRD